MEDVPQVIEEIVDVVRLIQQERIQQRFLGAESHRPVFQVVKDGGSGPVIGDAR